jgi:hypothetical protein
VNVSVVVNHPLLSASLATVVAFGLAAAIVLFPDFRWRRRQRRRGSGFIYGEGR